MPISGTVASDQQATAVHYNNLRLDALDPYSGAGLTTQGAQLSADVAMTVAGTYYDALSLSLAAGTWLIMAVVTFSYGTVSAKLWNGTTVYASAGATAGANSIPLPLVKVVVLASTTTVKVSGAGAAGSMLAATSSYGSGNNATTLVAVRIA